DSLARAVAAGAAGTICWAVPFVALVGPRALVTLGRDHLAGHFGDWGGSIATRPEVAERVRAFFHGAFFDGISPSTPALAALLVAVLVAWRFRRPDPRHVIVGAMVAAPYAAWALLGQNVIDQPRHLLPIALLAIVALSLALARSMPLSVGAIAIVLAGSLP